MKNKKWIFYLMFVIIVGLVCFPGHTSRHTTDTVVSETLIKKNANDTELTIDSLMSVVKKFKPKYPDIIVAQAIEESGHFKSSLFKKHGNLFGMKKAGSRPTVACYITNSGYAGYCGDKILMSVTDRILLDASFYRGLSKDEYFAKLGRTYASNPNYVKNLKRIILKYNLQ